MVLSQRVLIHLSGGHHGHTLFVTKRSRSRCDVFGFSANNNWILMSRQSRPQAQQKKRIQHEYDRDSGAPPSRQRETWSSRTRLFFPRRTPQDDGVTEGDGSRRNTTAIRSSQKKETRPHRCVHATSGFASVMVTHACIVSSFEASVCGVQRGTNSPPCHFLCATGAPT